MAKEILLYGNIYDWTAEDFIKSINKSTENDDITIRINTNGGSPESTFGMIAKFSECKGNKIVKVDGKAHSMGLFFLAYADKVEALDVSEFLLHRAAYASWFEKSEYFTEEIKGNLERMNKHLKTAFENKIDVAKFEQITGKTLKEIFSMDSRIDVYLTSKQAKQIGLIDTINKITPGKKAQINNAMMQIAAQYTIKDTEQKQTNTNTKINKNPKIMTLQELQEKHPDLFAQTVEIGKNAEIDRVGAWLVYADADIEAVSKGIKDGAILTATQTAEFNRKLVAQSIIDGANKEKTDNLKTENKEELTAEQKAQAEFDAEFDKLLKK